MEISIKRISFLSSLGFMIIFALACASGGCAESEPEIGTWTETGGEARPSSPVTGQIIVESLPLPTTVLTERQNVIARWSLTNPTDPASGGYAEVLRMGIFIKTKGINTVNIKLYEVGVGPVWQTNYTLSSCQTENCSVDLNFLQEIIIPGDTHAYELRADVTLADVSATITTTLVGHNSFIWSDESGDAGHLRSGDDAIGFGDDGLVTSQSLTR